MLCCSSRTRSRTYMATRISLLTFGSPLYSGADTHTINPLPIVERRVLRLILRSPLQICSITLYSLAPFPILHDVLNKLNTNYKNHVKHSPYLLEAAHIINSPPRRNSRRSRILIDLLLLEGTNNRNNYSVVSTLV